MTIPKGHRPFPFKMSVPLQPLAEMSSSSSMLLPSLLFHLSLDQSATAAQPLLFAAPLMSQDVAEVTIRTVTLRLRRLPTSQTSAPHKVEKTTVALMMNVLDDTGRRLPHLADDFPVASFAVAVADEAVPVDGQWTTPQAVTVRLPFPPGQRAVFYLSTDCTSGLELLCTCCGVATLCRAPEPSHQKLLAKMLKGGDVAGATDREHELSATVPDSSVSTTGPSEQQQQGSKAGMSKKRRRDEEPEVEESVQLPVEEEEVPELMHAFVAGTDSQS